MKKCSTLGIKITNRGKKKKKNPEDATQTNVPVSQALLSSALSARPEPTKTRAANSPGAPSAQPVIVTAGPLHHQ